MICTQPPLDVCKIMKNCCCRCLHCRLWGGGEMAGRMREWRSLGWPVMTIAMATFWAKKGLDKGKGEGGLKDGFVFWCCPICYCFLVYLFQCRSIDFLSRSSQLLDGLLLQDFSSSPPNLVVDWLFIKFKLTDSWLSLAKNFPFIQIWSSHFCLAILVWELFVANSCIWHWHETG